MTGQQRRRRNNSRDLVGRLATQSGVRTIAPMWPRPFFTPGEWAVYTALWSYPNDAVFPTHQDLADRAWVEWGTAKDAVAKMDRLALLERDPGEREDGSTSSNTYFLVEVPTAEHVSKLAAMREERRAEQERKKRQRKASKRKYEKPKVTADETGGCDTESTPVHATGGAPQIAPPGCSTDRTPGGAPQGAPGCDVERTLESLGVTEVLEVTLSATPGANTAEENPENDFSKIEDQETRPETADYVKSDAHWPELTEPEKALLDEIVAAAPATWSPRMLRKVIGSRVIREIAGRDAELVRRAFLLGAKDRGTVPMRLWHVDGCPHWERAARQLATEREPAEIPPGPGQPSSRENAAQVAEVVAPLDAVPDAAAPTASAQAGVEARARVAAHLAGRAYVPVSARTRDIARQRQAAGSPVGAHE